MKKKKWYGRFISVLAVCFIAVICFNSCGSGSGETITAVSGSSPETISSVDEKEDNAAESDDSSDVWTDYSEANAENEEGDTDMDKDSIFAMLKEDLGIDLSDYADGADGVISNGSIYYVNLTVCEGSEEEIERVIIDLCGEGAKASSRRRPILNNRLAEDFEKAELISVYDHFRNGTNGAKTVSTTIYTANIAGTMNVYIFGSK